MNAKRLIQTMKTIIFRILFLSILLSSAVMAENEVQLPPEPGSAAAFAAEQAVSKAIPRLGLAAAAALVVVPTAVIKVGGAVAVFDWVAKDYYE